MSDSPSTVKLLSPSEAYREVTGSLVYRLSELMFGSLLAAYSLGFIGAIAAHGNQLSAHGRLGSVLLALQYLCISLAFAYLTTSFYLTYHMGILTMPQLRFDRLGRDLTIAISQALFFGLSMLRPATFPISLSLNFLFSSMRKNEEFGNLAERLFEQHFGVKSSSDFDAFHTFREELAKRLQGKRLLSSWAPIGANIQKYGLMAFLVGLIVIGLCLALEYGLCLALEYDEMAGPQNCLVIIPRFRDKWVFQQLLISVELVTATIIIMIYGSRVLRRRASFIGFPVKIPRFRSAETSDESQTNRSANPQDDNIPVREDSQTDNRPLMDKEFDDLKEELAEFVQDRSLRVE